jgi:hypothetical protein
MRAVIRGVLARTAAIGIVAPFLTFASALAPAHVHEPGPGHEHEPAVAHSHFAPHHLEVHAHDALEGDEAPEIEHDDEHVVWIDSPILHETIYDANPIAPAIPVSYEIVQLERHWSVTPFDDAAPVHGPPKSLPLFRGPPFFLV